MGGENEWQMCNIPLSFNLNTGVRGTLEPLFLENTNLVLSTYRTTVTLLFVDFYVFFLMTTVLIRAGSKADFGAFPSDSRSGKVDLFVYLDLCRLGDSVTPIRRREDWG